VRNIRVPPLRVVKIDFFSVLCFAFEELPPEIEILHNSVGAVGKPSSGCAAKHSRTRQQQ